MNKARTQFATAGLSLLSLLPFSTKAEEPNVTTKPKTLTPSVEKPNILFVFADDQRWDAIGATGNKHIKTPNLDKLVKKSVVFTNGFCFGGNSPAVSIPARNMVMSGQTFLRFEQDAKRCKAAGIKRGAKITHTNPKWPNIPRSMNAAGYETYFDEKSGWANNPDVRKEFDHYHDIDMPKELATGRAARTIVNDAIKFMDKKRDKSKPFFMYLGLPCPHDPRWAAKRFRDMYNPENLPLPDNYLPQHPHNITHMTVRDECLEKWPRTEKDIKRHLHDYYALISSMDYDLGRLFDKLEEFGLDKNTIIIYSSDQGLAVGSKGLLGKQSVYDDVMRVPFTICGPGIEKSTNDSFVYTHDIFPTICDLVGAKIPENLDGKSLKDIILKKEEKVRSNLLLGYCDHQRSVSNGEWKLIRFPKINKSELYNIKVDPREVNNLSEDPKYAKKLSEMMELLKQEQKAYGDTLKLTSKNPKKAEFIAPTKKLKTMYPAGGLAPNEDDSWDFR